jgi:TPR repeat protein
LVEGIESRSSVYRAAFPAPCIAQPPATSQNELLTKAQTGDSDAQYQLGLLHERGSTDTPKGYSKALEWFRRSAEKGNPKAENALGIAYGHGYGVVEDDRAAFNWFYKAALKGFPPRNTIWPLIIVGDAVLQRIRSVRLVFEIRPKRKRVFTVSALRHLSRINFR